MSPNDINTLPDLAIYMSQNPGLKCVWLPHRVWQNLRHHFTNTNELRYVKEYNGVRIRPINATLYALGQKINEP